MASANLLTPFLKERLRLSAIPLEAAKHAGLRSGTVVAAREAGYELPKYATDGFLIPYYAVEDKLIKQMWRWRNDPDARRGVAKLTKQTKYAQPSGTGCWVYFPRVKGLDWKAVLANAKRPVVIVEGELKALSLACAGIAAVGLGGAWNYLKHKALLPELKLLAEGGRPLWIAYDSDTEDKIEVKRARYNLAKHVLDERAEVQWLVIPHLADPDSPTKTGADDLVRVWRVKGEELWKRLRALEAPGDSFEIQQHFFRMNADYVFNRQNGRVYETKNPAQSWRYVDFASVIENVQVVVGKKIGRGGKPEDIVSKLGQAWLGWPNRNLVAGRVYEPREQDAELSPYVTVAGERYLNNWAGWASRPEPDPEGVAAYFTRLLDHLFQQQGPENETQKRERETARRWLEMWFAYPVQNPGSKLYSSAVMLGKQGGGKSLLGYMVGWSCYGSHFNEITQHQLDSRFTASWAANRSLVMGSEVTSVGDWKMQRRVSEILKNWITGEEFELEGKGVDSYKVKNVINLYFTANKDDAFFLEGDDRRYFIHHIPEVKLVDALGKDWVRQTDAYIRSEKGRAAIHYHLLNEVKIDPRLFNPKGAPPETEAKRQAQEYSQNVLEHWLAQFDTSPEEVSDRPRGQQVFRMEEVYEAFLRDTGQDKKSWSEHAFIQVFRTRFFSLGRAKVAILKTKRWGKDKQCWVPTYNNIKTGLWVRKPSFKNGATNPVPTLAEAKIIWAKQTAAQIENG